MKIYTNMNNNMMKRVYCIVSTLLLSAGTLDMGLLRAEPTQEPVNSTTQVAEDSTERAVTAQQQEAAAKPVNDARKKNASAPLDLAGCILGAIALLGVLYVFYVSKNSAKKMEDFERNLWKAEERAEDAKEKAEQTRKESQT